MPSFWDRRADEDAFYFVDNRVEYGDPDLDRFWQGGRENLDRILEQLGVRLARSDRVVEIGCGVGRLTRVIAERAAGVRALDVSERMLERARELNPELANVSWILGDGRSMAGIEDASADACVSHVVFQHIPDPAVTLGYVREIGRVLRPGGWAAFQVSNDPSVHRPPGARGRLSAWLGALTGRGPRGQTNPAWRGSAVELDDLRSTAEASGMDVERVVGAGTQFCLVLTRRRA